MNKITVLFFLSLLSTCTAFQSSIYVTQQPSNSLRQVDPVDNYINQLKVQETSDQLNQQNGQTLNQSEDIDDQLLIFFFFFLMFMTIFLVVVVAKAKQGATQRIHMGLAQNNRRPANQQLSMHEFANQLNCLRSQIETQKNQIDRLQKILAKFCLKRGLNPQRLAQQQQVVHCTTQWAENNHIPVGRPIIVGGADSSFAYPTI